MIKNYRLICYSALAFTLFTGAALADIFKSTDAKRQSILEAELKAEKAALSLAKEAYANAASKPEIAHQKNSNGTVSTYRNMAKFNEKMQPLQAEVNNHQNKIELLQKELNGMR